MDTKAMQTGDPATKESGKPPAAKRNGSGREEKEAEVAHILCGMQLTTGSTKPESSSSKDGIEEDTDTKSSTVSITTLKNSNADGARSDTANVDPVGSIDPTSACINRFPVVGGTTLHSNRASNPNIESKASEGTMNTIYPAMPPLLPASGQQENPVDRRGFFNNFSQVSNVNTNLPSGIPGGPEGGSKKPLMALGSARVTDLDVLLGRGGMTNKHPGNVRFRSLVDSLKPSYLSLGSSKKKKKQFSETLMHKVMEYGGRFLVCHQGKIGMWTEADLATARKKCSQALREGKVNQAAAAATAAAQTPMPNLPTPENSLVDSAVGPYKNPTDNAKSGSSSGVSVIKTENESHQEIKKGHADTSQSRKRKISTLDPSLNTNDNGNGTDQASNAKKMPRIDETQKAFGQVLVESALKKIAASTKGSETTHNISVNAGFSLQTIDTVPVESMQVASNENVGITTGHSDGSESGKMTLNKPYSEIVHSVNTESKTLPDKPYRDIAQCNNNEPKTELTKKAFGQDIVESASKLVAGNPSMSATQNPTSVSTCGDTKEINISDSKELAPGQKTHNSIAQNEESVDPSNSENVDKTSTPSTSTVMPKMNSQLQPNLTSEQHVNGSNGAQIVALPYKASDSTEDSSERKELSTNVQQKGNVLSTGNNDYKGIMPQQLPIVWNNLNQEKMQLQLANNGTQHHIVVNGNMSANATAIFHQQHTNITNYSGANYIPPAPQNSIAIIPNEKDVLLGRGGFTNKHSGNIRFREIVAKEKDRYISLGNSKKEKKRFSEHIVSTVHSYGGRFLVKEDNNRNNNWIIADPKAARKKCSQALREGNILEI